MSKVSILHISDTHFGSKDTRMERSGITDGLIKKTHELVSNTSNVSDTKYEKICKPDICIFSGDLIFSGKDEEYIQAEEWLDKLIGVWDCPIFLVPGNHDVQRPSDDNNDFKKILRSAYSNEKDYNMWRSKVIKAEFLSSYCKWHKEVRSGRFEKIVSNWDDPCICRHDLEINGINIHLIGINTNLLSCDDEDEGKLVIDIQSLNKTLQNINHKTDLVIGIGHHPIGKNYLVDWCDEYVRNRFLRADGLHLYMHGHIHKSEGSTRNCLTGQFLANFGAGAVFQDDEPISFQFAFYNIDLKKQNIKPWTYRYNKLNGNWELNNEESYELRAILPYYNNNKIRSQLNIDNKNGICINDFINNEVCDEIMRGNIYLFEKLSLIDTKAPDDYRERQFSLFVDPILDLLRSRLQTNERIEDKLQTIISKLQQEEKQDDTCGIAAGNCLNLLSRLKKGNLNNLDFSHLVIKNAYLQNIKLHNVNFASSKFNNCTFSTNLGSILSIAFDPKNKYIATGDAECKIGIWDVNTGSLKSFLYDESIDDGFKQKAHTNYVWSVAFSPDGKKLASGSGDRTIKLWDIEKQRHLKTLTEPGDHKSWIRCVAFSPNGKYLASGSSDHMVLLWDLKTMKKKALPDGHNNWVWSVEFSPDNRYLISGGDDQIIRIWDYTKNTCINKPGHRGWVRSVTFFPESKGNLIASGSSDNTVKIWDVNKEGPLYTLTQSGEMIQSIALNPDGSLLATGSSENTVRLWKIKEIDDFQPKNTLRGHNRKVWYVAFSPDGKKLASGGDDQTIILWDVASGKKLKTLQGYTSWARTIAFNRKGTILASGDSDQLVKLRDVSNGKVASKYKELNGHTSWVNSIAFNPIDNEIIASGSDDGTIRLWNSIYNESTMTFKKAHSHLVSGIIFNPNGKYIVSCGDDHFVKVWNIKTKEVEKCFNEHNSWVWSIAYHPKKNIIASGGEDHMIFLWDPEKKNPILHKLKDHNGPVQSVAFSRDGKLLASGSEDNTVRLWDTETGKCIKILKGHESWIWSVAFSYNDQILASGSDDKTIILWDTKSFQPKYKLKGHKSWIWSLDFSPDGKFLASSSQDESIKIWDIETGKNTQTLYSEKIYQGMDITDVKGLDENQKNMLIALGAQK